MKLEAETPTETRLKAYLDANAPDALREKIAALPDRFNLDAAWRFIQDEARKKLKNHSGFRRSGQARAGEGERGGENTERPQGRVGQNRQTGRASRERKLGTLRSAGRCGFFTGPRHAT